MNDLVEEQFDVFFNSLKKNIKENKSLYTGLNNKNFELFKKLFISFDSREVKVDGVKTTHYFMIINDIELNPEYKGLGVFTKIIENLEKENINVWVDDIVNNRLFDFLYNKGYRASIYKSAIGWTSCMYKLKSQ